MPAKYDLSRVEATVGNGSLTLRLTRSEAAQKRSITVKAAAPVIENKPSGEGNTVDAQPVQGENASA